MTDAQKRTRARYPVVAEILDAVRAEFGDDCVLTYASENGRTMGERAPRGVTPTTDHYHMGGK